ncbi:general secretion pathway protein F [Lebetimonas natsushimae]|uniref:General secretion pathway protein F n=1 Tax=Lebetimonas natsushimae TaxID=1936991 RepID=A0A292YCL9_9BACT|nr:type II secretion system F family protein [Lebetimonas natsushimae]GAX87085.1 general secretion pathway protein F [Lebetimonas natsushimae]
MWFKITYLSRGKLNSKIIKAKSPNEAVLLLKKRDRRAIVRKIEEIKKESVIDNLLTKLDLAKIDLEEYISVIDQMYVMLDAGLGIDTVLDSIKENIKNKKLKKIFYAIANDIRAGLSLSDSVKKFEKDIGTLSVAMIQLGEETGDIARAMQDLSQILTEILENRKRLKKATRYPVFIIFAMMIAFVVVILFVIPPFKSLFTQLNTELPLPTRFLLWIEYAFENYGLFVLIGALIIFGVLTYLYNSSENARLKMDKLMLKIYIVGPVIKLAMIGRFIFVMQRLIEAGIPIINAVDIALNIVDNRFIYKKLLLIKNSIQMGGTIKQGFKESGLFENMIVQMIAAGEESGALVLMLQKASNYYLGKYRYIVDNIAALIEPILIAAIAGFVFTLALGIFLPMWNLTEAVQ